MKKKIFCFDIDNTICSTFGSNYINSKPIKNNILLINDLFNNGHFIKLFTSRFMGRSKENQKKAKKKGYSFTKKQLRKWGVKYNKLIFGKPSYDVFIDDKNLSYDKNWEKIIRKNLNLKKKYEK